MEGFGENLINLKQSAEDLFLGQQLVSFTDLVEALDNSYSISNKRSSSLSWDKVTLTVDFIGGDELVNFPAPTPLTFGFAFDMLLELTVSTNDSLGMAGN